MKIIILGHRGEGCTSRNPGVKGKKLGPRKEKDGNIFPENSLSAFENAFRSGADGFECDVFLSKDNVPMVIHDNQLARNVDGYHFWDKDEEDVLGNVSDYTAAELRDKKFSIGNDEHIPTLDELIQLAMRYNEQHKRETGSNLTLNIELKGTGQSAVETYKIVKKYIDDPNCPFVKEDFLFNSFDRPSLVAMKQCDPTMRCALGVSTKELYTGPLKMPGWIPPNHVYSDQAKENLRQIGVEFGLDLVTSDLQEDVIGPLCQKEGIPINLAINALRVKLEAVQEGLPSAALSDLEREKIELDKLVAFSEKYDVQVYYKSDSPALMKEYLHQLEQKSEQKRTSDVPVTMHVSHDKTSPVFFKEPPAVASPQTPQAKEGSEVQVDTTSAVVNPKYTTRKETIINGVPVVINQISKYEVPWTRGKAERPADYFWQIATTISYEKDGKAIQITIPPVASEEENRTRQLLVTIDGQPFPFNSDSSSILDMDKAFNIPEMEKLLKLSTINIVERQRVCLPFYHMKTADYKLSSEQPNAVLAKIHDEINRLIFPYIKTINMEANPSQNRELFFPIAFPTTNRHWVVCVLVINKENKPLITYIDSTPKAVEACSAYFRDTILPGINIALKNCGYPEVQQQDIAYNLSNQFSKKGCGIAASATIEKLMNRLDKPGENALLEKHAEMFTAAALTMEEDAFRRAELAQAVTRHEHIIDKLYTERFGESKTTEEKGVSPTFFRNQKSELLRELKTDPRILEKNAKEQLKP